MGVIIAAPYAGDWLVAPDQISYMYGETPAEVENKSSRMQAICDQHRVPLAAAALQFPLAHPAVAAVIPGARSPKEATEAQRFLNTPIPAELWNALKANGLLDESAPTPES
jgi:D-threo-aldose 1-dehydrogenase